MHSPICEKFATTSQQSYFCLNIDSWGQLWPESQTSLLSTFKWGQAQWVMPCFPLRQVRATTDICRSRTGFSGNHQEEHGLLHGRSWRLPPTRREKDVVLLRDRPWFPPYPPKVQTAFCLSQPPSVGGDMSLHIDCKNKDFNTKCCFAEKMLTLMIFFRISFFFSIYINIMPHISVTFIQTSYSWVAKCCLCP